MTDHMSTAEAAKEIGVCVKTVRAMYHAGTLEGWTNKTAIGKRNHAIRITKASVEKYKRQRTPLQTARAGLPTWMEQAS